MSVLIEEMQGSVLIVRMNHPPVNGLGLELRLALWGILSRLANNPSSVKALVLAGAGRMFSAGADIREFGDPKTHTEPRLAQVVEALETGSLPCVAAIHGVAAGGGMELALGAHERVAAGGARLGLPEVTLGLLPGAGGTQRVPRLVGVSASIDIITSGKLYSADEALELGLIDAIADDPVLSAIERANELIEAARPLRRCSMMATDPALDTAIFSQARDRLNKRTSSLLAPQAALSCIEAATTLPFADGMTFEREQFVKLLQGKQSKALRYVFFAERATAKMHDVQDDLPSRPIRQVGVVGCGVMGGGIAMVFADAGIPVTLVEADASRLEQGMATIRSNYDEGIQRGRYQPEQVTERIGLFSTSIEMAALSEVDLVIEAVFEDQDLKKQVFSELDAVCKEGAILATNTSMLNVNEIAASTKRPSSVIGLHFFSPAHLMKLLEIVRGDATSPEIVASCMRLSRKLGKTPVVSGVCDGFIGNRMMFPCMRAAEKLLLDGVPLERIDQVLERFGFAMGPFRVQDLAGIDVIWRIHQRWRREGNQAVAWSGLVDRLHNAGRWGQKTGQGWYRYQGRKPVPDDEVIGWITEAVAQSGGPVATIKDDEIVARFMYPMINEGARILEEKIAHRASDIDIVWNMGYGFPRWLGGPMFYGDDVGLDTVRNELIARAETEPAEFAVQPAQLLRDLADRGEGFADFDQRNAQSFRGT